MSLDVHRERYVDLVTFKRDGSEAHTPIWFAPDPDDDMLLWMYTNGQSFKVKRIRRDPRARVAACNASGKVHGRYLEAEARVIDDKDSAEFRRAFQQIEARYGWQARLVLLGSWLGGTYRHRTALAVRLTGGRPA